MPRRYTLLLLLFALSGCNKILEYYNHSNHQQPSNCKIDSINYYGPSDGLLYKSLAFEYSENGRLKGVFEEYPASDPEGFYSEYWPYNYDEKGRLVRTGALSTPHPSAAIYVYEGDSKLPARDTIIQMGGPTVEEFEYDPQGRIITIKERIFAITEEGDTRQVDSATTKYYYDLRGNRQEHPSNFGYSGLIKYSDKPSLYTLSPAFNLQYKDWSRNSTLVAESYNEHDLPLKLASDQPHPQPLVDLYGGEFIVYKCE